jgi:hypothetical protein
MSQEVGRPVDSVQIATLLEDTVVDVADVDPTPRRRGLLPVLIVASAIAFAAALGAFAHGVRAAAQNKAAERSWVIDGHDILDFRPARMAWGWDFVALFGAATGVACAALAVLTFRARPRRGFVHGGHLLVHASGDGEVVLRRAPGMAVEIDGTVMHGDIAAIGRGARLRARAGAVTFLVTRSVLRQGGVGRASGDRRLVAFAIGSAVGHALLVGLFTLIADDAMAYSSDEIAADFLDTHIRVKAGEPPREEPEKDKGKDGESGVQEGSAAEIGREGKAGTHESERESGKAAVKKTRDTTEVARKLTTEEVRDAGALGVVRSGRAFAAVTGQAELTSGLDDRDVFGGWDGQEIASQYGGFGSGLDGDGPGGGGRLLSTIGGNRYLVGPLGPTGTGYRPGIGDPRRRPRSPGDIIVFGTAQVKPGVDKNTIRRYVRQKQSQIAHCYERELLVHPTLHGTVTARWTIDPNGRVIAPIAKGMETVDSCVVGVLQTIQFPAGETIEVTAYPFHFRPVGS